MTLPDLTSRDRDAILARALRTLRTVYPDWTDERLAAAQNMILSVVAGMVDSAHWYIDHTLRQSRLTTTTLRPTALLHAEHLGYDVPGTAAAVTDMLVVLDSVPSDRIEIAPGDIAFATISTNPVTFNVSEAVEIPAGQDPPQFLVPVENAETTTEIFVSDGTEKQHFTLRQGPYIQGSAVVSAGGEPYEIRTTLTKSEATDAHVEGRLTEDDRLRLRFGDGNNGKTPTGQITVTYKFGGGRAGIVEAETIKSFEPTSIRDIAGNSYNIASASNPERAKEGQDRESLEKIQQKAPRSRVTAADRTIAYVDYINHAEEVNGVARAFLMTHRNAPLAPNEVKVLIVPEGGGLPSDTLRARVLKVFEEDKPSSPLVAIEVLGPDFITVDITATVYLTSGTEEAAARSAIEAAYETFFDPVDENGVPNTKVLFGAEYVENGQVAEIPYHQLLCELQNQPTVFAIGESESDFLVNGQHANVDIGDFQFPLLGTISLFNAATGLAF